MSLYVYEAVIRERGGQTVATLPDFDTEVKSKEGELDALKHAIDRAHALITISLNNGTPIPSGHSFDIPEGAHVVAFAVDAEPSSGLFYTVEDVADALGVTRTRVANLIHDNVLDGIRVKNRRYITRRSVESYLRTPRRRGTKIGGKPEQVAPAFQHAVIRSGKAGGPDEESLAVQMEVDLASCSLYMLEAVMENYDGHFLPNRKYVAHTIIDDTSHGDLFGGFTFEGHNFYNKEHVGSTLAQIEEALTEMQGAEKEQLMGCYECLRGIYDKMGDDDIMDIDTSAR